MTRFLSLFIALLLMIPTLTQAQDVFSPQPPADIKEVTDEELHNLVKAALQIQPLQQKLQQDMIAEVEKSGMEVMRFSQIVTAIQQDQSMDTIGVTEEELETFDVVSEKLGDLQDDADDKMIDIIEEYGFDVDRFQEIFNVLQMDTDLQERYLAILSEYQEEME